MNPGEMGTATRMRTVLVTGANRGLGLETCRQLAGRGFHVILTSRSHDGARAAQQLADDGLSIEHRALDVTDAASITALDEALREDAVSIDVLVNNAGIALQGFDAKVARKTVDFFGAMNVTDGLMTRIRDGGGIVMVSSGLGESSCVAPPLMQIVWAAALEDGPTGGFFRDGKPIAW